MTPRLRFRPRARAELLEARDWYEARSPGLGLEFAGAVDAALALVVRMPEAFPSLRPNVRHALLRRFPYSLLDAYENDEVIVLTVHHHKKAPTPWHAGAHELRSEVPHPLARRAPES